MTVVVGVAATFVLCALIAAALLTTVQRRHRLRVQTLLERLADFEQRHDEATFAVPLFPAGYDLGSDLNTAAGSISPESLVLGNDPLSGKTSDVRRLAKTDSRLASLSTVTPFCFAPWAASKKPGGSRLALKVSSVNSGGRYHVLCYLFVYWG